MKVFRSLSMTILCMVSIVLYTSCESPLDQFTADGADNEVLAGRPAAEDCGECKKGINYLELEYRGDATDATIKVYKDKVEHKKLIATFTNVNNGDILAFSGPDKDGKMGAKIRITVNDAKDYTEIHTSCSQDIYVGMTFGDYYIASGSSVEGGPLCTREEGDCGECKKGITYLDLEYQGNEVDASIKIYKDKVEEKKLIASFDNVNNGDVLSFSGVGKDNKMGAKIRIVVNGAKKDYTEIHTSCSQDIYVGMVFGDYEILSGESLKGGALCPMPNPEDEECGECEKGITHLDVEFIGTETNATIEIYKDKIEPNKLLATFNNVNTGEIMSFTGVGKDLKMGAKIRLVINGDDDNYIEIHTSCSQDIYTGMTFGNKYHIVGGRSLKGGPLCPMPDLGDEECDECEGQISHLSLEYLGDTPNASIKIYKDKIEPNKLLASFNNVNTGDILSFTGVGKDLKMGAKIRLVINDDVDSYIEIHTSCSQDIYTGMIFGNTYHIVEGRSVKGGPLCPNPEPPVDGDCGECKKGITYLELQYMGAPGVTVTVYEKKGDVIASWDNVNTGQVLAFSGNDNNGKMGGSEITVSNGIDEVKIHVSCSQDIYAGMVFGDYLIVAGTSLEGGALCGIEYCITSISDLVSSDNTVVGQVVVTDNGNDFEVTYTVDTGWCITQTSLDVESSLGDIPTTNGVPQNGQFEYNTSHNCVQEFSYLVPKSEGMYIAAYAEINCEVADLVTFENALPNVINDACVIEKGPAAGDSYFNIQVGDASYAGIYDAWCVDQDNTLNDGDCFSANVYSSYEPLPAGEFEHPEYFDELNWLINQNIIGQNAGDGDGNYTMGDIQLAIWDLVDDSTCSVCEYIGPTDPNRVNKLVAMAKNEGSGFVPGKNQLIAVVLIPNDSPRNLQSVIIPVEVPCIPGDCQDVVWAAGCAFPGGDGATYFQLPYNYNP